MTKTSSSSRLVRTGLGLGQLEGDLLALDRNLVGRLDPDPDRVAVDLDDRDADIRADVKTLAELPAQD